jgi:hypothetical protein
VTTWMRSIEVGNCRLFFWISLARVLRNPFEAAAALTILVSLSRRGVLGLTTRPAVIGELTVKL